MARTWKSHRPWKEYPLRTCRWMNDCAVCKEPITSGQRYYDGGYTLRVHEECADKKTIHNPSNNPDAANAAKPS